MGGPITRHSLPELLERQGFTLTMVPRGVGWGGSLEKGMGGKEWVIFIQPFHKL